MRQKVTVSELLARRLKGRKGIWPNGKMFTVLSISNNCLKLVFENGIRRSFYKFSDEWDLEIILLPVLWWTKKS